MQTVRITRMIAVITGLLPSSGVMAHAGLHARDGWLLHLLAEHLPLLLVLAGVLLLALPWLRDISRNDR